MIFDWTDAANQLVLSFLILIKLAYIIILQIYVHLLIRNVAEPRRRLAISHGATAMGKQQDDARVDAGEEMCAGKAE